MTIATQIVDRRVTPSVNLCGIEDLRCQFLLPCKKLTMLWQR